MTTFKFCRHVWALDVIRKGKKNDRELTNIAQIARLAVCPTSFRGTGVEMEETNGGQRFVLRLKGVEVHNLAKGTLERVHLIANAFTRGCFDKGPRRMKQHGNDTVLTIERVSPSVSEMQTTTQ